MTRNRATYAERTARRLCLVSMSLLLPSSVIAAAINADATISTNPSTTVTSDSATAVTTVKPHHRVYNVTAPLVEQDELEHSMLFTYSDLHSVLIASISTLLPLIFALGLAWGVRYVWRNYNNGGTCADDLPWYKTACSHNTAQSQHNHPHFGSVPVQSTTRVLSAQDLVNGLDVPRYMCETDDAHLTNVVDVADVALTSIVEYTNSGNHTSKNANGNIITLTLKNNHLIVETEERAVTMEDSQPASRYKDNGCSFVVEVQPDYDRTDAEGKKRLSDDVKAGITDQHALVHREEIPDDRSLGLENARLFGSINTGWSQSDLSISSQGSANPSYRYGNQVEYNTGHLGYPMYGGSYESDAPSGKLEGRSKWVEFNKSPDIENALLDDSRNLTSETDQDQNPEFFGKSTDVSSLQDIVNVAMREDSLDMDGYGLDAVRSNPNLQVNGTTPNKLEIMEQKALSNDFAGRTDVSSKPVITGALLKDDVQEDAFQEQQRKLGNGTLTPEHKEERVSVNRKAEGSVFVPSHKRASSIPPRFIEESLIEERKKPLDIYNKYSQIKTSTRGILPGLSPKFELLQNEVSPIEEKES